MISTLPFGRTGHISTRILFGAAALGAMTEERAEGVLECLLEYGINHIDVAAMYGNAEVCLAPWLAAHPGRFFLATKTGDRDYAAARASIHRSLERMGVDSVDLIQLHNLTDEDGWQQAMRDGGALQAAIEARDEGLVRFIGVTGHGTRVAEMHLRSLERFDFDSVLLPYNYTMMQNPQYAADFEALLELCEARNVAVQTIKGIARRRWRDDDTSKRFSWYEPLRDPQALRRATHWCLSRAGVFFNTSSDATLLRAVLEAASEFQTGDAAPDIDISAEISQRDMEPLFIRDVSESV